MRAALVILALFITVVFATLRSTKSVAPIYAATSANNSLAASATTLDFDADIKPIFQARCQPCHFAGGKVYDRMPFDKAETIHRLGAKLFTRIKDEREQRLIREFLDQK
jgi:uncharacterized membrane protein